MMLRLAAVALGLPAATTEAPPAALAPALTLPPEAEAPRSTAHGEKPFT